MPSNKYNQFLQMYLRSQSYNITNQFSMIAKTNPIFGIKDALPYYLLPSILIINALAGLYLQLPITTLFLTFGILPLCDNYGDKDWQNPTLQQIKELENQSSFRIALYVSLSLDWIISFLTLAQIQHLTKTPLHTLVSVFLMATLYTSTFLISHELLHKNNLLDKITGTVHQLKCLYMHFTIEHIQGHHKRVATPEDSAFAPLGMNVYQFIPKSIYKSYISAFKFNPKFVIGCTICYVLFLLGIYWVFDVKRLFYAILSAFGGVSMLEIINYIEHYGLQRKRLPNGSYQKVNIRHSWNAPHRFSNYLFFKLQRHSDHHQNSLKPYQTLCTYEDSPQLPHSYLICIIMALYPKKWFQVINPLVKQYQMKQGAKGTQLQWMSTAVQKSQQFVINFLKILFTLMIIQLSLEYTNYYLKI